MRLKDGARVDAVCPAYVETDLSREVLAKRTIATALNVNGSISPTR